MRVRTIFAGVVVAALAVQVLTRGTVGEEPDDVSRLESDETTRLIAAELPNWKLWKGSERESKLKLEPKSVLRWTNPGTGRVFGDVYIWTSAGRPEAVMSLFKAWQPANGFHVEMHSLSLVALEAERSATIVWKPQKAGLKIQEMPDAPAPASTPARRLTQMRSLADEFSADLTDFRQNDTGEKQPLRLLPQPMYRYHDTGSELIDGAMFGFVLGTDPEVFLLIEAARSSEDKSVHWQYGIARMNDNPLQVKYRDIEVWRADRLTNRDGLRDPYVLSKLPETPTKKGRLID